MGATLLFSACSDDRGSNPTLSVPDSFVLNTPAYAEQAINLKTSESVNLTWSQPDYGGFPVAAEYSVQISLTDEWTVSNVEEMADESGETQCNYYILDDVYSTCSAKVNAANIAKAIVVIGNYAEDNVPAEVDVYARVIASISGVPTVASNSVKLRAIPYYIELKDAPIGIWFITGAFTPDGGWKNNADGSNMLAMLPVPGADVDKTTGETILEWAGYIPAGSEFKIIAPAGLQNWNYGLCGGDESGGQVYRDGGDDPGNIKYTAGGWVKLTLDTKAKTLTFTAINGEPTAMTQIAMPGSYQPGDGWDVNSNLLTAAAMSDAHDWTGEVTFESDCKFKFAANGAWDINWGSNTFPIGAGTQNGSDIPGTAGTYKVYFNDILGYYYLVSQ